MKKIEDKKEWIEIVDAWRASGLSKAEFCKKQKITVSAFYYWCRKFENAQAGKSTKNKHKKVSVDENPAFVEINIPQGNAPSNAKGRIFRITTSYGAVMELPL